VSSPPIVSGLGLWPDPPTKDDDLLRWAKLFADASQRRYADLAKRANEVAFQGTEAQRPAAIGSMRSYFATDTGILYLDTGSSWTAIGGLQSLVLYSQVTDSAAINNTAAETYFNRSGTLKSGVAKVGDIVKAYASGKLSTTGTVTFKFFIRIGGGTNYLFTPIATVNSQSGASNEPWSVAGAGVIRAIGASGTLVVVPAGVDAGIAAEVLYDGTNDPAHRPNANPISSYTLNFNTDLTIETGVQMGTAAVANTATMLTFGVELLRASATS
jgi:hypothetical protein